MKQKIGCVGCGCIWEIDVDKAKIGAVLLQCPLCFDEEILGERKGGVEMKTEYRYLKVTKKLKEALEREHIDVEARLWEILGE